MKAIKIKETDKAIFIDQNFVSSPKSLIASQIFNIRRKDEDGNYIGLNISKKGCMGYDEYEITGEVLNTGLDFHLFITLMVEMHETGSNDFVFDLDKLYKRVDPKRTNPQNNNIIFARRVKESSERLQSLKVTLRKAASFMSCVLFPTVAVDFIERTVSVSINTNFRTIFEIDHNAIYNIDFDIYNNLDAEYSKILYLFYLTNNKNLINKFSIAQLKERLMAEHVIDKKFNSKVTEANEELKSEKIGFLTHWNKFNANGDRTVTHFEVSTKIKKEIADFGDKIPEPQEEVKQLNEKVKEVVKSQAALEMEKHIEQSRLMNEELNKALKA